MAQLKWTTETEIQEFGDSANVTAWLGKDADTRIEIGCAGNKSLSVAIRQSERMQESSSEEIEVGFDDEPAETISVRIGTDDFYLSNTEYSKLLGNYDPVKLVKKLARHSKFRLRYQGVDLTLKYDQASAKDAIGKVLGHCGHELEPSAATETTSTGNSVSGWPLILVLTVTILGFAVGISKSAEETNSEPPKIQTRTTTHKPMTITQRIQTREQPNIQTRKQPKTQTAAQKYAKDITYQTDRQIWADDYILGGNTLVIYFRGDRINEALKRLGPRARWSWCQTDATISNIVEGARKVGLTKVQVRLGFLDYIECDA